MTQSGTLKVNIIRVKKNVLEKKIQQLPVVVAFPSSRWRHYIKAGFVGQKKRSDQSAPSLCF